MNLHLEGERIMGGTTMSRRNLLRAGAAAMAGAGVLRAATARAWGGAARAAENASSMTQEGIIRSYYTGWEKKDWSAIDRLLGESFTLPAPTTMTTSIRPPSKQDAGHRRTGSSGSSWRM